MTRLAAALFLVVGLASTAQADKICTEMGCTDGLDISVSDSYRWKPGKYNFDFTIDGKAITCTGTLPLKPCGQPSITCDCAESEIQIIESGCALPPQNQGFGSIAVRSGPKNAAAKISREGQVIGSGQWSPVYLTVQPNGPDCEPICRQARVEIQLKE